MMRSLSARQGLRSHVRNRRRLSKLLAALALVCLLAVVAGCGSGSHDSTATGASGGTPAKNGRELTMGIAMIDHQSPTQIAIQSRFEEAGKTQGYKTIITDPHDDASKQVQLVRALIQRGVDGLVIGMVNPASFDPVLDEVAAKRIPTVIIGDPPVKAHPGLLNISFNWHDYGSSVGKAFADCMNKRFGGKGEVGLITTTAIGGPPVVDRMNGVQKAIEDNAPGVKIVGVADGHSDRAKSVQAARSMLQAHPDIVGFTGIGDIEVLAAMQASKEKGKDPKKGCFVGLDASDEGIKALKDGDFYAELDPQYDHWLVAASTVLPLMARDPKSPFWDARTLLFSPGQVGATG
jgi:galactofuranose transport system substrate-binding protein